MLKTKSLDVDDTNSPAAVTAVAGMAGEWYGNFMLIMPKDNLTLKHPDDLKHPNETGTRKRINWNTEARAPPHHGIPEGTILVVGGNDKLDKALMQRIKDSGLFADVVEGTWQ